MAFIARTIPPAPGLEHRRSTEMRGSLSVGVAMPYSPVSATLRATRRPGLGRYLGSAVFLRPVSLTSGAGPTAASAFFDTRPSCPGCAGSSGSHPALPDNRMVKREWGSCRMRIRTRRDAEREMADQEDRSPHG